MSTATLEPPAETTPGVPFTIASSKAGSFLDNVKASLEAVNDGRAAPAAEEKAPEAKSPEAKEAPVAKEAKAAPAAKTAPAKAAKPIKDAKGVSGLLDDEVEEVAPTEDALSADELKEMPASANTPEAQLAWTTLKKENKAFTKELETLRQQVAERSKLADADPIRKENDQLKKELEEARNHLKAANVTKHPIYQERIDKPLQRIGAQAVDLAKRTEVDGDKLLDIIREPDPKRQRALFAEVASEMDDLDRTEFANLITQAKGVYAEEDEIRKDALEAAKELETRDASEKERSKTESKAAEMRAISDTLEKVGKISKYLAIEGEETPEDALKAVSEASQAKGWDEMDKDERAFAVVASNIAVRLKRNLAAKDAKIKSLEASLAGYTTASPSAGRGEEKRAKETDGIPEGASFAEAVSLRLSRLGK